MEPKRRGNPNMIPGAPSVNPGGRPRGAAGLARYVAEQTKDGRDLVDRLLVIAKSDKSVREAAAACVALLDRMVGKPMASHELSVTTGTPDAPARDWSSVPLNERLDLLRRLRAVPQLGAGSTDDNGGEAA